MYLEVSWPRNTPINQIVPGGGTIPIVIPAGTTHLIHNINLGISNVYEEFNEIDELVIYHGRGEIPISVTVEHNNVPVIITLIPITSYFEGSQLPPDSVGLDLQRVVLHLSSPMTVKVTLNF